MTVLEPLYCWAPSKLRDEIGASGLIVKDKVPLGRLRHKTSGVVCCAPTPRLALAILPLQEDAPAQWDLYQVVVTETDTMVVSVKGKSVKEVRVGSTIPKARVYYVGSRLLKEQADEG